MRLFATGGVLTVVALLAVALVAWPSSAVTLPSVKVPSVHTPPVSVPSVSTPVGRTPSVSVPSVSTPSVSTPSVSTPRLSSVAPHSLSVGGGSGPSVSVGPGGVSVSGGGASSPGSAPSTSAAGGSVVSPAAGGSAAGGSGAGSARTAAQASDAPNARPANTPYQRKLETIVMRYSGCLSTLSPEAAQVLALRAGVGVDRAYTAQQVAHKLEISSGRESRLERNGLAQLQSAGESGSCGSSFVLLRVPAGDQLVAQSPVFVSAVSGGGGGASATAARSGGHAGAPRVLAASRVPSSSASGIQNAAIHIATSTPALVTVGGAFGLLVLLAALSLAGRHLAAREQMMLVAADAPAPYVPVSEAADAPAAAATPEPSELPSAPASPPPPSPAPPPVAAERPTPPPPGGSADTSGDWLRTHRSQIAFVLTAVAGGTLRMLARNRRKR